MKKRADEICPLNLICSTMDNNKTYELKKHTLKKGEKIKEQLHPNADEWIVGISGRLDVRVDFALDRIEPGEKPFVHVPKGYIHSAEAYFDDVTYFVLRSKEDETIYLDDIIKKKDSVTPFEDPCGTMWELFACDAVSIAYVDVTGTAKKHKHPEGFTEIYRVEKGKGELVLGKAVMGISKGAVIDIRQEEFHYLKKLDDPLEVIVITHPKFDLKYVIFED